jgi:hypothetical protein
LRDLISYNSTIVKRNQDRLDKAESSITSNNELSHSNKDGIDINSNRIGILRIDEMGTQVNNNERRIGEINSNLTDFQSSTGVSHASILEDISDNERGLASLEGNIYRNKETMRGLSTKINVNSNSIFGFDGFESGGILGLWETVTNNTGIITGNTGIITGNTARINTNSTAIFDDDDGINSRITGNTDRINTNSTAIFNEAGVNKINRNYESISGVGENGGETISIRDSMALMDGRINTNSNAIFDDDGINNKIDTNTNDIVGHEDRISKNYGAIFDDGGDDVIDRIAINYSAIFDDDGAINSRININSDAIFDDDGADIIAKNSTAIFGDGDGGINSRIDTNHDAIFGDGDINRIDKNSGAIFDDDGADIIAKNSTAIFGDGDINRIDQNSDAIFGNDEDDAVSIFNRIFNLEKENGGGGGGNAATDTLAIENLTTTYKRKTHSIIIEFTRKVGKNEVNENLKFKIKQDRRGDWQTIDNKRIKGLGLGLVKQFKHNGLEANTEYTYQVNSGDSEQSITTGSGLIERDSEIAEFATEEATDITEEYPTITTNNVDIENLTTVYTIPNQHSITINFTGTIGVGDEILEELEIVEGGSKMIIRPLFITDSKYIHSDLKEGTAYTYRVKSLNSGYSAPKSKQTGIETVDEPIKIADGLSSEGGYLGDVYFKFKKDVANGTRQITSVGEDGEDMLTIDKGGASQINATGEYNSLRPNNRIHTTQTWDSGTTAFFIECMVKPGGDSGVGAMGLEIFGRNGVRYTIGGNTDQNEQRLYIGSNRIEHDGNLLHVRYGGIQKNFRNKWWKIAIAIDATSVSVYLNGSRQGKWDIPSDFSRNGQVDICAWSSGKVKELTIGVDDMYLP